MMQAQDIMTKDVVTISGSATVANAGKLMKDKRGRALIVDSERLHLWGMRSGLGWGGRTSGGCR